LQKAAFESFYLPSLSYVTVVPSVLLLHDCYALNNLASQSVPGAIKHSCVSRFSCIFVCVYPLYFSSLNLASQSVPGAIKHSCVSRFSCIFVCVYPHYFSSFHGSSSALSVLPFCIGQLCTKPSLGRLRKERIKSAENPGYLWRMGAGATI